MDAIARRDGATGDRWNSELHEEISRLAVAIRRAVVLCDLEGVTQMEAARELGCGGATVRRRLAGAVLRTMTRTRHVKLAALLVAGAGLAMAWAADSGQRDGPPAGAQARPGANGKAAKPAPDAVRVRWVHLKTDTGEEVWVNLDDGRQFTKAADKVSLLDIIRRDLYTYEGRGSIVKTKDSNDVYITDRDGRLIPPAVFDVILKVDESYYRGLPRHATEQERKTNSFVDYDIETIGGRRYGRTDRYSRDALGRTRLEKQFWFDLETKRLFRRRERLEVALQYQFKKEFATTEFEYPEDGPRDLFALGVPRGTAVLEAEKTERSSKWGDQAPDVRRAIAGQAAAIRRFPRHFRAVTYSFEGRLVLEYWSASAEFIQLWCEQITSDAAFDLYNHRPRHLVADHQDLSDLPQDVKIALLGDRQSDLPVDRIAAWFPYDRSNNIRLFDGKRTYLGSGMPPRIRIKVLRGGFDSLPALMEADWPAAHWNRSEVSAIPPLADTPPGCLTIRTASGDFRDEFTIDPARDFIAVRHLEWQKNAGKWDRNDRRAVHFKQLASGAWYVTAWELRRQRSLAEAEMVPKPDDKDRGELYTQRIEITPLKPGELPKDIFDGAKFIEAARKAGAVIKADAKNEREAGDLRPEKP